MEAHLLTASLLHCPKVQALVPLTSRDTLLSILQRLCSPQEGVLVSKNSLQRASGHSCGQACLTCDPQLTGSGAREDVPFNLLSVLRLCIQVTAQCHQGPKVMPQPCAASAVPTQSWFLHLQSTHAWKKKKKYVSSRVQCCSSKHSGNLLWFFLQRKLGVITWVLGLHSRAPYLV